MPDEKALASHGTLAESVVPVYGYPVAIRAFSSALHGLVTAVFEGWAALHPEHIEDCAPLELKVTAWDDGTVPDTMPEYDVQRECVYMDHGNAVLLAERDEGAAFVNAPASFIASRWREYEKLFLECAVYFIATARDRVPVHAAAVLIHGRPALIAGPSNSGKSTLLYALARRGCPVLAEESTCIAHEREFALWGCSREIGLRPAALEFFPELAAAAPVRQPNGKLKHVVRLRQEQMAYPRQTGPAEIIFLASDEGGAAFRAMVMDEARARLLDQREAGFDLAPDYPQAIDALLRNARAHVLPRAGTPDQAAEALLAHFARA